MATRATLSRIEFLEERLAFATARSGPESPLAKLFAEQLAIARNAKERREARRLELGLSPAPTPPPTPTTGTSPASGKPDVEQ